MRTESCIERVTLGKPSLESLEDPAEEEEPEEGAVDDLEGEESGPEDPFTVHQPVFDLEVFASVEKMAGVIRIFNHNKFSGTHDEVG